MSGPKSAQFAFESAGITNYNFSNWNKQITKWKGGSSGQIVFRNVKLGAGAGGWSEFSVRTEKFSRVMLIGAALSCEAAPLTGDLFLIGWELLSISTHRYISEAFNSYYEDDNRYETGR